MIALALMIAEPVMADLNIPVDHFNVPAMLFSCAADRGETYSGFYLIEMDHSPTKSVIRISRSFEKGHEEIVLEDSIKSVSFNGNHDDGTWLVRAGGTEHGIPVEIELLLRAGDKVRREIDRMTFRKNGAEYRNGFCMFMPPKRGSSAEAEQ